MSLKRTISTPALLMLSIGSIVGSGWLFGPLYVAQIAGPAAIICWIIGGCLIMLIAFTFAELGTMFPVAGGMVRFVQFSHGPLVSFTLGWIAWLAALVIAPIETLAMIQYASNYIPWLMNKVNDVYVLSHAGMGVAACLLFLMCCLNMIGAHFISKANVGIVVIKLLVPVLTIIVFLTADFHPENFSAHGGFFEAGFHGILNALPTAGVIFSFIGFSPAIQMAGESKNPSRAIPIAIIGSLSTCIVLYILIQTAFIGALDHSTLQNGWQQISFKGEAGPFAGIAMSIGFMWLLYALYADALISPFGTGLIYTTTTARVNFALSKNGYMPKSFQILNKAGVPVRAVLINTVIGLILFLPFPGWESMVSFLVSAFVMVYAVGPIALLSLRYMKPDIQRPFRLPMVHSLCFAAFYVCNLLIFWTGWQTVWKMLVAISIGYIYLAGYRNLTKHGRKLQLLWKTAWWIPPYFIGLGLISYLGTFGGGTGYLTFGYDFLAVALFSLVIFYFAVKAAILHTIPQDHELV